MKRRIAISTAVVLSVILISLVIADYPAEAQNQLRVVADTGIITPGPNQILRVSGDGVDQDDVITFRFRRIGYQAVSEGPGITRYSAISDTITNSITATGVDGITATGVDGIGIDATRIIVMCNRPNVRVNGALIDAATGTTQVLIALLLP
jgi:hypothetical protein